jgi:hypothetical protein
MIILIEPVTVWKNGGAQQAEKIAIYQFYNYDFAGDSGAVAYRLLNADDDILTDERLRLPEALVADWGADDQPIFDYVLETLKLEVKENG